MYHFLTFKRRRAESLSSSLSLCVWVWCATPRWLRVNQSPCVSWTACPSGYHVNTSAGWTSPITPGNWRPVPWTASRREPPVWGIPPTRPVITIQPTTVSTCHSKPWFDEDDVQQRATFNFIICSQGKMFTNIVFFVVDESFLVRFCLYILWICFEYIIDTVTFCFGFYLFWSIWHTHKICHINNFFITPAIIQHYLVNRKETIE